MKIESQQLGTLEVPPESIVEFPFGIPGFPDAHQFCLVEVRKGSRFMLLQCAHDPKLAFVVMDPTQVDPQYPMAQVQKVAAQFGLDETEPMAVATIVSLPAPPAKPTVNMLAPIAMGTRTRIGVQVILHDSPYSVRHEL